MGLDAENIIFTGFMGTGKTSVGKMISQWLNYRFIDIDEEVKKQCSMSICDIFTTYGEKYFRKLESDSVRKFARMKCCVIATGGGVVLNPRNMKYMGDNGVIIRLSASRGTIIRNIAYDFEKRKDRPLLIADNVLDRITQLMQERESLYRYSDYDVTIDGLSVMQVAERVLEIPAVHVLARREIPYIPAKSAYRTYPTVF